MVQSKRQLKTQIRNLSSSSESKTIYFAMKLPLQLGTIMALIQILNKS